MNAIEVEALSLSLGRGEARAEVLHGVSFTVGQGEFVCAAGRNGAGKSTVCRCLAGIYRRCEGSIKLFGRDASSLSAKERARLIAYVPQSTPSDVPFTSQEFVEMSRYAASTPPDVDRREASEALELVGASALAHRRMCDLSGGERQRVLIASAVAQRTPCLLLDEPTTYLDCAHQAEAMRVISRVGRERGIAIFAVTHDINMALALSSRIVALTDGRVAFDGTPLALLADDATLESIFGIRFSRYTNAVGEQLISPPYAAYTEVRP